MYLKPWNFTRKPENNHEILILQVKITMTEYIRENRTDYGKPFTAGKGRFSKLRVQNITLD